MLLPRTTLGKPGMFRAVVSRIETPAGSVVMKDVSKMSPLFKPIARMLLDREAFVYEKLRGVEGVPRSYGKIDDDALLIEFADGTPLHSADESKLDADFFERLYGIVREIHSRGVVHLDLHQRWNILVDSEGNPRIIDFGASIYLGSPGVSRDFLLGVLGKIDLSGLIKFKMRYRPDSLTDSEKELALSWHRARLWWPFKMSRKRLRRRRGEI
ncbi:MAG: hypothetical protein NUW37_06725 [Planctomycetes bacterium]|nr:hypothetical protein [Planctomycetota bacterium]